MNDATQSASNSNLKKFVRQVVGRVELTAGSKYQVRPDPGGVGYTFGDMQNNTWGNKVAGRLLDVALGQAAEKGFLDKALVERVQKAIETERQTLSQEDLDRVSDFLMDDSRAAEYRKLIDDLDDHRAGSVADEVEAVIRRIQATGRAGPLDEGNLDPETIAILAAWANRVRDLNLTSEKLVDAARKGELTPEKVREVICNYEQFKKQDCAKWIEGIRDAVRQVPVGPSGRERRGDAGGGEVHVKAHSREDYSVRAYDRSWPSR